MNENTLLTDLRARLLTQNWTGSSNVVFPSGSVNVTANTEDAMSAAVKTMRPPMVLLQPMSAESDPEHDEEPDLIRLTVNVRLIVMVPGDATGENAVLGANETGGTTQSQGRGITDVEQELYNSIGKLNALEGYTIQFRQKGNLNMAAFSPQVMVGWRDYTFEAWITAT